MCIICTNLFIIKYLKNMFNNYIEQGTRGLSNSLIFISKRWSYKVENTSYDTNGR